MKWFRLSYLNEFLLRPVHIAPLVVFRILFGALIFGSIVRFFVNGWIEDLYIKPEYYFSYYGFEWVKPLGSTAMYILFAVMALSYLMVMLGWFYRISICTGFLTFTYVELIDKANYLNHYYFVSVISFLLIFLPAHRYFSIDIIRKPLRKLTYIPQWTIAVLKLQLAIVYIYAGIAKLNYDWLIRAMPLKIWLPAHADLPLIGWLMDYDGVAYLFSWFGAIYDLFIVFFLMNKKTRLVAYFFVILFHVVTRILFPIGMFPYIMIFSTLIFFSEGFHKKIIHTLMIWKSYLIKFPNSQEENLAGLFYLSPLKRKLLIGLFSIFFILQFTFPWRFVLYPGNLFWTEQGYRFSWRVMLMEKAGTTFFYVREPSTGRETEVMNCDYLTKNQEKMMATQPDMILQFAHFIEEEYEKQGIKDPEVRVESYVTLNGSGSRLFLDRSVDLTKEEEGWLPKKWILPFNE